MPQHRHHRERMPIPHRVPGSHRRTHGLGVALRAREVEVPSLVGRNVIGNDINPLSRILTLPRLRIDQLMAFCWQVLLPFAFLQIIINGWVLVYGWPDWVMGVTSGLATAAAAINARA